MTLISAKAIRLWHSSKSRMKLSKNAEGKMQKTNLPDADAVAGNVAITLIVSGIAGVMLAGANMPTDAQLLTLIAWFYQPRVILLGALLSTLVSLWFLWLFNDLLRALAHSLRSRAWYFDVSANV